MPASETGPVPVTDAAVDRWVRAARIERLDLHFLAAHPSWREREAAFARMSEALDRAINQVQAVHAAWRACGAAAGPPD